MNLTWKCHVCGDERPDEAISVYKKWRMLGEVEAQMNIRYCNDRPSCTEGAPDVDLLGERHADR